LYAISACLLGVSCRYDGSSLAPSQAFQLDPGDLPLPVCPEQLGGLPTPRPAARIVAGTGADVLAGRARVVDATGRDVTAAFLRGAQETLRLCRHCGVTRAVLKSRSPSCGVGWIHGSEGLLAGDGVTAALLRANGIEVVSRPD